MAKHYCVSCGAANEYSGTKPKKCEKCKIKYPSEILSPLLGSYPTGNICGICALKLTNQIHGIKKKKFTGKMAEKLRLKAILWRKKHN